MYSSTKTKDPYLDNRKKAYRTSGTNRTSPGFRKASKVKVPPFPHKSCRVYDEIGERFMVWDKVRKVLYNDTSQISGTEFASKSQARKALHFTLTAENDAGLKLPPNRYQIIESVK